MDERCIGDETADYLVWKRVVGCGLAGNIFSLSGRRANAQCSPCSPAALSYAGVERCFALGGLR